VNESVKNAARKCEGKWKESVKDNEKNAGRKGRRNAGRKCELMRDGSV
jgi:hypothetical protein